MKIAIDMDNTIVDELGATLRPGIIEFLDYLYGRHELVLWTSSRKTRAYEIISHFKLRHYFSAIITRDDYDPNDEGVRKDIANKGCRILIDDDPEEIEYVKCDNGIGILIEPYRKNKKMNEHELPEIIKKFRL